jgi:hypothetical protein
MAGAAAPGAGKQITKELREVNVEWVTTRETGDCISYF